MSSDNPLEPPSGTVLFLYVAIRLLGLLGIAWLARLGIQDRTGLAYRLEACEKDRELFSTHLDQLGLATLKALRDSQEEPSPSMRKLRMECPETTTLADCHRLVDLDECQKSNKETLKNAIDRYERAQSSQAR